MLHRFGSLWVAENNPRNNVPQAHFPSNNISVVSNRLSLVVAILYSLCYVSVYAVYYSGLCGLASCRWFWFVFIRYNVRARC